jgi:hypothetical protein
MHITSAVLRPNTVQPDDATIVCSSRSDLTGPGDAALAVSSGDDG